MIKIDKVSAWALGIALPAEPSTTPEVAEASGGLALGPRGCFTTRGGCHSSSRVEVPTEESASNALQSSIGLRNIRSRKTFW